MEFKKIPLLGFSEPLSSMSHLIAALFFLIAGLYVLYKGRGNLTRVFALLVYFGCNVFLFSMSGVYHLLEKGSDANYVLQILDHAGIFLMIAGSFTPFQIILLRGNKRWIPLFLIWTLAINGITFTSIFFDDMPEALKLSFYIGMGWMAVFTVWFIRKFDPKTVSLIILGGIFYTLGAIMDYLRWPVLLTQVLEAHEIFHILIVLGATTHLYAISRISHLPISDTLTVVIKKFPNRLIAYPRTENALLQAQSDDELRQVISQWIHNSFHEKLRPKRVRLRYFEEDHLNLEQIAAKHNKESDS